MSKSAKSQLESLLFVSARPMTVAEISQILKKDKEETKKSLEELSQNYEEEKRGFRIIKSNSSYQMVSSPDNSKLVSGFIQDETSGELTRPSLEALTIIAYRGPVSKIDLERIRGVNCSLILRNLLMRGLIISEKDSKKEEIYYSVSLEFLRFLGISDIKELPDFEKLSRDDSLERILEGTD